jgi:hypothetical protein
MKYGGFYELAGPAGGAMERIRFIRHKAAEILYIDFSDCKVTELFPLIARAKTVIASRPRQSLLTLTNVTGTQQNDAVNQQMKLYTAHNKPYVKAAAVVGIEGLKKILLDTIVLISKRQIHPFETVEQAKDWLAEQK